MPRAPRFALATLESIPHRPPWSLIDRVVSVEADRVLAEKRVTANDPLLGDGMRGPLCIEAVAQAAACLMGARGLGEGHRGYLVAAHGWRFRAQARPGDTVGLEAVLTAQAAGLHRFAGRASVGRTEIASGTLTLAIRAVGDGGRTGA